MSQQKTKREKGEKEGEKKREQGNKNEPAA